MNGIEPKGEDNNTILSSKNDNIKKENEHTSKKINHKRPETKDEEKYAQSSKRFKTSINSKSTTSKKSNEVKFNDTVVEIKDNLPSNNLKDDPLHMTPKKLNSPMHKLMKSVKEHRKTPYSKLKENDSEEEDSPNAKFKKNDKLLLSSKKQIFSSSSLLEENPFLIRSENSPYNLRIREKVDYVKKNEEFEKTLISQGLIESAESDDESLKEGESLSNKSSSSEENKENSSSESYESDTIAYEPKELEKEVKEMNKNLD